MANNRDQVQCNLRDVLELRQERDQLRAELARLQRNEDCVQRLIVWAAENGWNGVDNAKILDSFIIGLFDELRAELMTARETIAAAQEEVAALCAEHNATVADRNALAADNARLRKALEAAFDGAARQLAEPPHHGNDQYALTAIATTCELALAATPAQSLAAHDAALLREVADGVDKIAVVPTIDTPQSMRDLIADAIRAKADRIEKEAQRGQAGA